ncbi:MAG: DUF4157 domain-containing protein [Anaerolineae bacterium]|nr:DUF4157 domain-containing protein [Anaerolineae bacterium]
MSSEHLLDTKGKVAAKPTQEAAAPQKDNLSRPLTTAQIQGKLSPATLTQMQRTVGNSTVQRFLAQRSGGQQGPSPVDDETANLINSRRGAGQSIDEGIAGKAGSVMGQDFSGVNVHTDSTADNLSRNLGAVAFTTGNDIFFRSGAYNPKSSDGQQLISHELTHVVQQGASMPAVQGKMTVNDPNDQYEAEADSMAAQVMSKPDDFAVQQQEEDEMAMGKRLQRQEEEEMAMPKLQRQEEEEMAMPKLQRQEEEEMAMGKRVQRQEEEEMAMPKLQRQEVEMPEEEIQEKAVQREEEDEIATKQINRKPDIQRHGDHDEL